MYKISEAGLLRLNIVLASNNRIDRTVDVFECEKEGVCVLVTMHQIDPDLFHGKKYALWTQKMLENNTNWMTLDELPEWTSFQIHNPDFSVEEIEQAEMIMRELN